MLLDDVGLSDSAIMPYLNTRTMLDVADGRFEYGTDNHYILNGGISPMTGIVGRAQYGKSTTADSFIAHILSIYRTVEAWKHDTENNTLTKERYDHMSNAIEPGTVITERIKLTNSQRLGFSDYIKTIHELGEYKLSHKKDYLIETPFKDPRDRKPLEMLLPTLIFPDSWSELRPSSEAELLGKTSIEDSKHNTADMNDGKLKAKAIRLFSQYAAKYGFYFIFTAHVDDGFDLDPYNPSVKQLQWMRNKDRMKGVGSKFEFLTSLLLQVCTPRALQEKVGSEKVCKYPTADGTASNELSEIGTVILRCKTNCSGTVLPFLVSQHIGLVNGLTNYEYLRNNEDYGLIAKQHNRYCMLLPDLCLTRNTIRTKLEGNYELQRALEILAQLKFMSLNWAPNNFMANIPETAEKFVEAVQKSTSIKISDILNSRGYWTWDKTDPRPYLSTLDILMLLQQK